MHSRQRVKDTKAAVVFPSFPQCTQHCGKYLSAFGFCPWSFTLDAPFQCSPRESCWIWIHSSMKWCVTAIISEMKWVARWQWFREVKSLHSPVCFCYGVTTAHVNIWNTFNCCKQRCSLDAGSCYWEAVLTVPEGILELRRLQMRVRKEMTTLC